MQEVIIAINPGSTSIRMALYHWDEMLSEESVSHSIDELAAFDNVADQFKLRMIDVNKWLAVQDLNDKKVIAIAGRGAPLRPMEEGIYGINERMLADLHSMRYSNHASNLGAIIADHLSKRFHVPAVIVEPVTIDNFTDFARVSGVPGIERLCRSHALNIKEVCRREAQKHGKSIRETRYVVAHMGGGISVAAVDKGLIVDVNDALLGMGPFSPNRAGAMPIGPLVQLAYSGKYTEKSLTTMLSRESGLQAYLGETDVRKVEKRIDAGDKKAALYYDAMIYQIAKEVGYCAAVLKGQLDGILLTGGMAMSEKLTGRLREYTSFLSEVVVHAGEYEMSALTAGAIRVLRGEETLKEY